MGIGTPPKSPISSKASISLSSSSWASCSNLPPALNVNVNTGALDNIDSFHQRIMRSLSCITLLTTVLEIVLERATKGKGILLQIKCSKKVLQISLLHLMWKHLILLTIQRGNLPSFCQQDDWLEAESGHSALEYSKDCCLVWIKSLACCAHLVIC